MPRTPAPDKTNNLRQRRFRQRKVVRAEIEAALQHRLGREPTPAEMLALVEQELSRMELGADAAPPADPPPSPTAPATPSAPVLSSPVAAAAAGLAFELNLALAKDEIFARMMAAARAGDTTCLMWLASRLAPPPRPRRFVELPEVQACDLAMAAGIQLAIERTIAAAVGGRLSLEVADMLLRALAQRLAAAESVSRCEAFEAAKAALAGGGALTDRLETLRRRLALVGTPADDAPQPDTEAPPWH